MILLCYSSKSMDPTTSYSAPMYECDQFKVALKMHLLDIILTYTILVN